MSAEDSGGGGGHEEQPPFVDYYGALGVENPKATLDEIRKAHRKIVMDNHPDIHAAAGTQGDPEKLTAANEAWEVLRDATKRAEFDARLKRREQEREAREAQQNRREAGAAGTAGPDRSEAQAKAARDKAEAEELLRRMNARARTSDGDPNHPGFTPFGQRGSPMFDQNSIPGDPPRWPGSFWDKRRKEDRVKPIPGALDGAYNDLSQGRERLYKGDEGPGPEIEKWQGQYYLRGPSLADRDGNASPGMRMSEGYDLISKQGDNYFAHRAGTWRLLNPKTGERMSEVYELISNIEGNLIASRFNMQYLLDPATGRELSTGYDKIKVPKYKRVHNYLIGVKGDQEYPIDRKTGKRMMVKNDEIQNEFPELGGKKGRR